MSKRNRTPWMMMHPDIILETERLMLRKMTPDDAAEAFALNNDPEVIRYTGDPPFSSVDHARAFLMAYPDYALYGMGRWAVVRKADGQWLGWCGLKSLPELNEVDLGYRLHRCYWGMGYATEASMACIGHGFMHYNLPFIVGRVMRQNIASIKVLEKVGMHFWKEDTFHGGEGLYYRIDRPM